MLFPYQIIIILSLQPSATLKLLEPLPRDRDPEMPELRCPKVSHHRADTAIALLIATVASKAGLRDRLNRFVDRAARAGGGENPVDRSKTGGDHRAQGFASGWRANWGGN